MYRNGMDAIKVQTIRRLKKAEADYEAACTAWILTRNSADEGYRPAADVERAAHHLDKARARYLAAHEGYKAAHR